MRIKVFILALLIALLPSCGAAKVVEYKVKVVKEYPHDVTSYTQGLFFHDGRFYESTGQWGSSTLRIVDLESGKPVKKVSFNNKYFIEGSVVFGGDLYVLTWTNKVAFKYNPETLEYKSTQGYPREGWGMTTDGKQIIASDGSSQLYFMDKDLKVKLVGETILLDMHIGADIVQFFREFHNIRTFTDVVAEETGQCLGHIGNDFIVIENRPGTNILKCIVKKMGIDLILKLGKFHARFHEFTVPCLIVQLLGSAVHRFQFPIQEIQFIQ